MQRAPRPRAGGPRRPRRHRLLHDADVRRRPSSSCTTTRGMGLGGGTGSGIDPFITNKQIVFMGDGTFFHSGQIAITNAIKAGQDITLHHPGERHHRDDRPPGARRHRDATCWATAPTSRTSSRSSAAWPAPAPITVVKLSPGRARRRTSSVLEKTILADGVKVDHRRQGMRHHPSPHGAARGAADRQGARLPAAQDAHERHAGGVRDLPGMHQADRLPGPDARSTPTTAGRSTPT